MVIVYIYKFHYYLFIKKLGLVFKEIIYINFGFTCRDNPFLFILTIKGITP